MSLKWLYAHTRNGLSRVGFRIVVPRELETHYECNLCIIYCVTAVILKTNESSLRAWSNFDNTKLVEWHESNADKSSRFCTFIRFHVPFYLNLTCHKDQLFPILAGLRPFMETATNVIIKLFRLVGYPVTRDLARIKTHIPTTRPR